jgi:hypothetical protein
MSEQDGDFSGASSAPESERRFDGIWIPREIWECEDLTPLELILWAEIHSLDKGQGCYATNAFFARRLRVSERYVREMISKLRSRGYVRDAGFDGKHRYLKSGVVITRAGPAPGGNPTSREEPRLQGGTPVPGREEPQFRVGGNSSSSRENTLEKRRERKQRILESLSSSSSSSVTSPSSSEAPDSLSGSSPEEKHSPLPPPGAVLKGQESPLEFPLVRNRQIPQDIKDTADACSVPAPRSLLAKIRQIVIDHRAGKIGFKGELPPLGVFKLVEGVGPLGRETYVRFANRSFVARGDSIFVREVGT